MKRTKLKTKKTLVELVVKATKSKGKKSLGEALDEQGFKPVNDFHSRMENLRNAKPPFI